jgi:hypothetical protein
LPHRYWLARFVKKPSPDDQEKALYLKLIQRIIARRTEWPQQHQVELDSM